MSNIEIEHRYLLHKFPEGVVKQAHTILETKQGYISSETISERFSRRKYMRSEKFYEGQKRFTRNVKIGHGLSRLEFKEDISKDFFEAVWPISKGTRIYKVRHRIDVDGVCWEVDNFIDRELFLAEVEVPDIDFKVTIPKWLEKCIEKEVTTDLKYEGRYLAK